MEQVIGQGCPECFIVTMINGLSSLPFCVTAFMLSKSLNYAQTLQTNEKRQI